MIKLHKYLGKSYRNGHFKLSKLSFATAGVLLAAGTNAHAATYYIDAVSGNDTWAGTAQSASGSNGPWRSLARLGSAKLVAGDAVLLACGQTWRETLRFTGSGTSSAPIRIAAFPSSCTTPPAIDGRVTVPASAWQLQQGSTYKAYLSSGPNVMANGNLSQGSLNWRRYSSPADAQVVFDSVCTGGGFPCIRFTSGSNPSGSTLITPSFAVTAGVPYTVTLRMLIPNGVKYTVDLRRMTAPYTLSGMSTASFVGNGAWQTVTVGFTPGATVPDARFDIGIKGAKLVALLRDASVNQGATGVSQGTIAQVFENNVGVTVAHHPNQGFNAAAPGSYFLSSAGASSAVSNGQGGSGSQYIVVGSDLKLPAGAGIQPGMKVTLRSSDWSIEEHTVTAFTPTRLDFSPLSRYALSSAGWGYYLTGALWMLDSPGEWFHDTSANTLYVQTEKGIAPGDSISFSTLDLGADLNAKSFITIQGLSFKRVTRGIDMTRSTGVQLQSVQISQSGSYGVYAEASTNPVISNSTISDTLGSAFLATNANGLQAIGNDITNSGVRLRADGTAATLPANVYGAIIGGPKSVIKDNRLKIVAYDGISAGSDSTISGNAVQSYCLVLNDCGAIHPMQGARLTMQGNLLIDGHTSMFGTPSNYKPHVVAMYLDTHSSASTVSGNTLANADWGMQLLDAYNHTVSGNLFYGNRKNDLWMQQRSNTVNATQGDVFGNTVRSNNFFTVTGNTSIFHTTAMPSAAVMASYDYNDYSTLASSAMSTETAAGILRTYTFPDWKAAVGPNGARGLDTNGSIAAPLPGSAIGRIGSPLIAPGVLDINTPTGWSRAFSLTPSVVTACPPGVASCMRGTASPTAVGILSSPKFPTVKDGWYRMSFDAAVSDSSVQRLSMVLRNASTGAGISSTLEAAGSTAFRRYSFFFKVTADASMIAPSTGAKIDFQGIQPNQWVTLANLELAQVTSAAADAPNAILYNSSRTPQFPACPVSDPTACSNFYSTADGTRMTWPARLEPLQAVAVMSVNPSLADSDRDGVADSQDKCGGTPSGAVVSNGGCSLGQ